MHSFSKAFLQAGSKVLEQLDANKLDQIASELANVRDRGGRLFFLGVGGSAGNCGHAVNDFRKICGFEAYAPTDNVSELTARTNDDGWDTVFVEWLKGSRLQKNDAIFIFSVGGGNAQKNVSMNLVRALDFAKSVGATIFGVVGKDGGHTAKCSDLILIIPTITPDWITPLTEAFHGIAWHCIVSHPKLKVRETKWESVSKAA